MQGLRIEGWKRNALQSIAEAVGMDINDLRRHIIDRWLADSANDPAVAFDVEGRGEKC
jgi:hypothetical protein